ASDPSRERATIGRMGEGRAAGFGRELYFLRSPASQEGSRPVRASSAPSGDSTVSGGHAETGGRDGESSARSQRVHGWQASGGVPSRWQAAGTHRRTIHVRFFSGRKGHRQRS